MEKVRWKNNLLDDIVRIFKSTGIQPKDVNEFLVSVGTNPISQKTKIASLLLRPQVKLSEFSKSSSILTGIMSTFEGIDNDLIDAIETLIKYEGYIIKERELAAKFGKYESIPLKIDFDYNTIQSLSYEAREKLNKIKPQTIGQAARISGVSPSDISVLAVYYGK